MEKPQCIVQYNENMNGVDRIDQQIQYYPFARRSMKWYKKFLLYLFQLAFHNSFILFKIQNPSSKVQSLSQYITSISRAWIIPSTCSPSARAPSVDPRARLDQEEGRHQLIAIVGKGKKQKPTRRCRVCIRKGLRHETRYECSGCQVPLHKEHCFSAYHSEANYA